MGVHNLGKNHLRRLSRIVGQTVYRAHTPGNDAVATCWIDQTHAALVNYRTGELIAPPAEQIVGGLPLVGWLDGERPADPFS